jgi:hypothetical protein
MVEGLFAVKIGTTTGDWDHGRGLLGDKVNTALVPAELASFVEGDFKVEIVHQDASVVYQLPSGLTRLHSKLSSFVGHVGR